MQNDKLKLTYFNAGGRAEPARLLLHIANLKFEDVRLEWEEFEEQKKQGKFVYGQLPVLEINGEQYAQSQAIIKYAALRANLVPSDPIVVLKIEQVLKNLDELIERFAQIFEIQEEERKKTYTENLVRNVFPQWLQRIEDLLSKNGSNGYITGNELTYGEIVLFGNLLMLTDGYVKDIPKDIADKYQNIQKLCTMIKSHPKVADWYEKTPLVTF